MRKVEDRHKLAAYHNKQCWRAFRGYQHRWPWTTLKSKNSKCLFLGGILGCYAHLKSEFSTKLLEIDQDNQRTKLNW